MTGCLPGRLRPVVAAGLIAIACLLPARADARDQLAIGITQFPSTLNPLIDSMLAKSYILAMAHRPVSMFDHDWNVSCRMCTELATFENGRAVATDAVDADGTPTGKRGVISRVTLRDDVFWGDGVPVTTRDVVFTWKVGRHPDTGVPDRQSFLDVHPDRGARREDLQRRQQQARLPLPGLVRAASARTPGGSRVRRAEELPSPHPLPDRSDQSRPVQRPVPDHGGLAGRLGGAGAQRALEGAVPRIRPHRGAHHREDRCPRGPPAVRRHRLHSRRDGPDAGPGPVLRGAPRRPVRRRLQAGADLRAHRSHARQPDPGRPARETGTPARNRPGSGQRPAVRG